MADLSIATRPLTVAALLTEEVETESGQRIGFVKDLIIDADTGAIAFAILSVGGLFGIGSKLYVVPWRLLERPRATYILCNARQVLAHAARWDEDLGITAAQTMAPTAGTDHGNYSNRN